MKVKLHNNKGETLVEIIIGVLLLAIASVCLVSGFVTSANIVNRANLMKNSSAAVSSSIEIENKYDVGFKDAEKIKVTTKRIPQIKFTAVRKGKSAHSDAPINVQVDGTMVVATETKNTDLKYREFFPTNFYEGESGGIAP